MSNPRSIRFGSAVEARLASYVARHPGLSASSVAARFVDEGLRMVEHPAVVFHDGASGRRATLVGGPDVWEVIRAVSSARASEPALDEAELLGLVSENTGVSIELIKSAISYWAEYPAEVNVMVEYGEGHASRSAEAAERSRRMLAG